MSTSSALFPAEQLCYVHCNICDTVLAVFDYSFTYLLPPLHQLAFLITMQVSVPSVSLFKTVTVRCGHCANLLPVNMRGLLLPSANQLQLGQNLLSPSLEEIQSSNSSNFFINCNDYSVARSGPFDEPLAVNKPPEKRQRVPSAYNRFIKDEIQRIKAGNPDITHREAFSAAAKNWAHFPHIHFGLLPDQQMKRANVHPQATAENVLMKDAFFSPANVGISPF